MADNDPDAAQPPPAVEQSPDPQDTLTPEEMERKNPIGYTRDDEAEEREEAFEQEEAEKGHS